MPTPSPSLWDLLSMNRHEIYARYPVARRFLSSGFEPDPRNHADNVLGLASLNQIITLNLVTGDITALTNPQETINA